MYLQKKLQSKSKISEIIPPDFHNIVQAKDIYLENSKLKKLNFVPKDTIYSGLDEILEIQ